MTSSSAISLSQSSTVCWPLALEFLRSHWSRRRFIFCTGCEAAAGRRYEQIRFLASYGASLARFFLLWGSPVTHGLRAGGARRCCCCKGRVQCSAGWGCASSGRRYQTTVFIAECGATQLRMKLSAACVTLHGERPCSLLPATQASDVPCHRPSRPCIYIYARRSPPIAKIGFFSLESQVPT